MARKARQREGYEVPVRRTWLRGDPTLFEQNPDAIDGALERGVHKGAVIFHVANVRRYVDLKKPPAYIYMAVHSGIVECRTTVDVNLIRFNVVRKA